MKFKDSLTLIKYFEGLGDGDHSTPGLQPYICPAGVWTIGYGATYGPDGHRVVKDTPTIDEFEAGELLKRDMGHSLRAVDRLVVVPINENQRGSLVSFTFNLGAGALSSSTLIRRINSYQWDDVPRQFSRWIMAGGQVLSGLIKRRRAETELWGQ